MKIKKSICLKIVFKEIRNMNLQNSCNFSKPAITDCILSLLIFLELLMWNTQLIRYILLAYSHRQSFLFNSSTYININRIIFRLPFAFFKCGLVFAFFKCRLVFALFKCGLLFALFKCGLAFNFFKCRMSFINFVFSFCFWLRVVSF